MAKTRKDLIKESIKLINECPVCHSKDIQQILSNTSYRGRIIVYPAGSYCNSCGVKFVFNTSHLKEDITKEKSFIQKMQKALAFAKTKGG